MASPYKRGDVYWFGYTDRNGAYKYKSSKVRISVFGPRNALRKAKQVANDYEIRELSKSQNSVDLSSILQTVENLSPTDKASLAIKLAEYLPEGSHNINNNTETFSAVRDEWLSFVKPNSSPAWITREKYCNPNFIDFLETIGKSLIGAIDTKDINLFIKKLRDEGKAPNTILNYLKPVSLVFEYAISQELVKKNPVSKSEKPAAKSQKEHIYIPSEALDAVFAEAKDDDRIFWTWLRYTGLNPIDVTSLTPASIQTDDEGKHIDGKRTKSGKAVRVPIHNKIEELEAEFGKRIFGIYPTKGRRDKSNKRFKVLLKKQGFESPVAALRHTFITNLFNQKYSPTQIAKIVGHTSTKLIEKIYVTHVDAKLSHEAVNKVV